MTKEKETKWDDLIDALLAGELTHHLGYAKGEMRIAAWVRHGRTHVAVFRDGGDIHGETAAG